MMEALSDWPTPPYFAFEPGSIKSGPESCLIYFLAGKRRLEIWCVYLQMNQALCFSRHITM